MNDDLPQRHRSLIDEALAKMPHLGVIAAMKWAVETEREACITELERNADKTLDEITTAIRARGNT